MGSNAIGTTKFRCPACGFQIFNRRIAKCESCGAPLPSELLFSKDQIAALDAEHEKSRKAQEARMRAGRSRSGDSGGGDVGSDWGVGVGDGGDGGD